MRKRGVERKTIKGEGRGREISLNIVTSHVRESNISFQSRSVSYVALHLSIRQTGRRFAIAGSLHWHGRPRRKRPAIEKNQAGRSLLSAFSSVENYMSKKNIHISQSLTFGRGVVRLLECKKVKSSGDISQVTNRFSSLSARKLGGYSDI